MKIVIPSNDGKTIAQHFGRAKGFIICETDSNKIVNKEYQNNTFTDHAQGLHLRQSNQHHQHNHKGIFNAIGDCNLVIAGGMGRRLYDEFQQRKINVSITKVTDADKAVELFLDNKLDHNEEICCTH